MPDGREEREEIKARIEEMKRAQREEQIDPAETGEWEPERLDS
jgi:hypothetical protein